MAEPAKVEQRYGVVDGPNGHAWVVVPQDRDAAHALNAQHDRRFWCSTLANGCGAQLSLHVGEEKIPHFSHYPGQAKSCPFAYDLEALERSYLHLALQHTLRRWLADQGFTATLEHTLPDSGGRADLYVRVDPGAQTIEVQLSPLQLGTWEVRTNRYARHVDRVSWLFGPHAGKHLLTATVRLQGYALGVKLASHDETDAADPATIQIGTLARSGAMQWVPLTACIMTANGITTPHVSAALAEQERWKAREQAAEQKRLAEAARSKASPDGGGSSWRDPSMFAEPTLPPPVADPLPVGPIGPRTPARVALQPRGTGRHPMQSHDWINPDQWTPPQGWGFLEALDPHLRPAGKLMAYLVSRIDASGPDWGLSFPDVDDAGTIQDVLEQTGLIELYDTPSGIRRWRRSG